MQNETLSNYAVLRKVPKIDFSESRAASVC